MQISRAAVRLRLPCRRVGLASRRSCTQKSPLASATYALCAAFWPKELREKTPICPYYLASQVSTGSFLFFYFLWAISTKQKIFFLSRSNTVGDRASRRLDESRGAAEEAGGSPTAPARRRRATQSHTGPLRTGHGRELHHPITLPADDGGQRIQPSFISDA